MLNEIEINKNQLSSLMGSLIFQMQLMKFLQKSSQAFLNVKCSLQLPMDMILSFQQKLLKESAGQRTQLISRKLKLLTAKKIPKSFQSYFGNSDNKTNLVKQLFKKWKGTLLKVLTSFQSFHDGGRTHDLSQKKRTRCLWFFLMFYYFIS